VKGKGGKEEGKAGRREEGKAGRREGGKEGRREGGKEGRRVAFSGERFWVSIYVARLVAHASVLAPPVLSSATSRCRAAVDEWARSSCEVGMGLGPHGLAWPSAFGFRYWWDHGPR